MHPACKPAALAAALALAFAASSARADDPALREAAQKAITTNPDVTARLNALRAAVNEIDVARGGLYPRVDLSASAGRDSDRITGRLPRESDSLTRNGVALSVNQLLWDGKATYREIGRLGHARLVRWFEFVDATEQAALEAARAYYDVQRYRRLVELAEDNYVQHKYTYDQLQSRVRAGVGRGVDMEQASARLSLAESNLTTEVANLHDVTARYERLIGSAPPAARTGDPLNQNIAATDDEAVRLALAGNAGISAAVENLRATRAQVEVREGQAWQPKVEARVRSGGGKNFDGVDGQKRDTAAEVSLSWNLFNGGSDRARIRQYGDLLNQAADQRDKACRDVRQTAAIARNDLRKLTAQLEQLDRNVLSILKARDAYRQQFEIGQRNLLDLLNAENELYTARRSYTGAEYDLDIAYARVHASGNRLVQALGLARPDDGGGSAEAAQGWDAGNDGAQRCPTSATALVPIDKAALDARAAAMQSAARTQPVASAPLPETRPLQGTAPVDLSPQVRDWAAAWAAKDFERYKSFYAADYAPAQGRAAWLAARQRALSKPGAISVAVEAVQTTVLAPDRAETRFTQAYGSQDYSDRGDKVLSWKREGQRWVITAESNR